MKPSIWLSPDARHAIILDKVAAIRPEGSRGDVMVLVHGGRLILDPVNAKDFTVAFLRFHDANQTHPTYTPKTQS